VVFAVFASCASLAFIVLQVADVLLRSSPLAPDRSPVRIHYRDVGQGPPIVILHGGWGYDAYPFDRQVGALASRCRVVIPDRTGYGGSEPLDTLPTDFHQRAADETLAVIEALELDRPILWGHSDGAIIALLVGLALPDRISAVIAEATHYVKHKPGSRPFFEGVVAKPRSPFVAMHSRTWIRIVDEAAPGEDFYAGRLSGIRIPMLLIHGACDPRTEPGELEALRVAATRMLVLPDGGHSPHSEGATAERVTESALAFVAEVGAHDSSDVGQGAADPPMPSPRDGGVGAKST
jgi:pimeloyl-ACP methyl ester carboxylesterase